MKRTQPFYFHLIFIVTNFVFCLSTKDEVKAAVVDIGSSLCRFGTAGEDLPRHLFRSDIGVSEDTDDSDHKIGDVSLRFVQSDVNIESVIGPDGTTDWDNYASLMNYGLEECMKIDTTEYPLMVSNSDYSNYLKSSENVSNYYFIADDSTFCIFNLLFVIKEMIDLRCSVYMIDDITFQY
jgi:hypothetical protein